MSLVEYIVTFRDHVTNKSCGSTSISNSSLCPEGTCSLQYNTNILCPDSMMILVTVYAVSKLGGMNASNSTLVTIGIKVNCGTLYVHYKITVTLTSHHAAFDNSVMVTVVYSALGGAIVLISVVIAIVLIIIKRHREIAFPKVNRAK